MVNTVIHHDDVRTGAVAIATTYTDIVGMVATNKSIAGPGSVVLLLMSIMLETTATDESAWFQFTVDGSVVGPRNSWAWVDQADEGTGMFMAFAVDGLSAGNHTFAVQGLDIENTPRTHPTRYRSFQVIEIKTGCAIKIDLSGNSTHIPNTAYQDVNNLFGSFTAATGAVHLFIANGQSDDGGNGEQADFRLELDTTLIGPGSVYQSNRNGLQMENCCIMFAKDDIASGSRDVAMRFRGIDGSGDNPGLKTQTRTLQVLEFTADASLEVNYAGIDGDTGIGATYSKQAAMGGTATIQNTDSVVLAMSHWKAEEGADRTQSMRLKMNGTLVGGEIEQFIDSAGSGGSSGQAFAIGGVSGSVVCELHWLQLRGIVSNIDTGHTKTFQVLDLQTAAGGTPVSNTAVTPLEAPQSIFQTRQVVLEASQGILEVVNSPIEALQGLLQTSNIPIEALISISQTHQVPIEALQGVLEPLQLVIESPQGLLLATVLPLEAISSINISHQAVLEGIGSISQTRQAVIEAVQGVLQSTVAPFETLGPAAVSTSAIVPIEALGYIAAISVTPLEVLQSINQPRVMVIEAAQSINQSYVPVIEALQSASQSSVLVAEVLGNVVLTPSLPIEALQRIILSGGMTIEALQDIIQSSISPIEALQDIVRTSASPFETLGPAAVSTSAIVPIEALGVVVRPSGFVIEARGQVFGTRSLTIEAIAQVSASSAVELEALQGILGTATLSEEALAAIALAANVPFEGFVLPGIITNIVGRTVFFQVTLDKDLEFQVTLDKDLEFQVTLDKDVEF